MPSRNKSGMTKKSGKTAQSLLKTAQLTTLSSPRRRGSPFYFYIYAENLSRHEFRGKRADFS